MRILRTIHTINPALGGPIESVMQSSAALIRRGHDVEIVSLDQTNDSWVRESPIPVYPLGPGLGKYGYSSRFSRWLSERSAHYDAVIVHGIWQYTSFAVWRTVDRTKTPYFVFPHGMLDPWFKRAYPLKHLKKLGYWIAAESHVLRHAAAVLFTSEEERRRARSSFPRYRCNEVVVNYGTAPPQNNLEQARAEFFRRFPELRDRPFLLFLGRLHEKKGCELLIQAFGEMANSREDNPSVDLVIAGPCADDQYLEQLKRMASSISGITFTGMLTGDCKWGALSAAEAFVLSSHQENFGIAVVEALACGTPVLISNKINIWREIAGENAGYVENDDLVGTKKLIERWNATEIPDRAAMKTKAADCFARRFEIGRATDSLLEVLQQYCRGTKEVSAHVP